jgi:hypothetical protein
MRTSSLYLKKENFENDFKNLKFAKKRPAAVLVAAAILIIAPKTFSRAFQTQFLFQNNLEGLVSGGILFLSQWFSF